MNTEATTKIDWTKPIEGAGPMEGEKARFVTTAVWKTGTRLDHLVEFERSGYYAIAADGTEYHNGRPLIRNAAPAFVPTPHEPLPNVTMWQRNSYEAGSSDHGGFIKIDGEWNVYWYPDSTVNALSSPEKFTHPRTVMTDGLDLTKLAAHVEKVRAERKAKAEPPKPVAKEWPVVYRWASPSKLTKSYRYRKIGQFWESLDSANTLWTRNKYSDWDYHVATGQLIEATDEPAEKLVEKFKLVEYRYADPNTVPNIRFFKDGDAWLGRDIVDGRRWKTAASCDTDVANGKLVPADDTPAPKPKPVYNQDTMMGAWVQIPGSKTRWAVNMVWLRGFAIEGSDVVFAYNDLNQPGWTVWLPSELGRPREEAK